LIATLGKQLENDGHGKWLCANVFQVFPQGVDYAKMGGYKKLFTDMQDKKEEETLRIELTQRQLNAFKREPYLIAWSIIVAIITISLSVIQIFCK
jgi:hypothetical protein